MLKRTPLYAVHQRLGARLVEFGGWEMPVQYTGIVDEHLAVRNAAGLFDISHMGEIFVDGAGALVFLNSVFTNDLSKCSVGRGQYTLMCNPQGGVMDDLYVYRLEVQVYLLIVNASRIEPDAAWLSQQLTESRRGSAAHLVNASDQRAAVAVQGPKVPLFIDRCFPGPSVAGMSVERPTHLKKNETAAFGFGSSSVWVSRTGYTGEDGFEIVAPADLIEAVWAALWETGQTVGLKACGLGARDTLRTEMCYPLYGHELNEQTTPIEAGLGYFVALEKGAFVGRPVLAEQKATGVRRQCVAFKMTGKSAPPRPGYPIWSGNSTLGHVASGTQSPSLGLGIGLGYVPPASAKPGSMLEIEIRGKRAPAMTAAKPLYHKPV